MLPSPPAQIEEAKKTLKNKKEDYEHAKFIIEENTREETNKIIQEEVKERSINKERKAKRKD